VKIHILDGTLYRGQIFAGMSKDHGAVVIRVRQSKKNNWACRWSIMILWSVGFSLQINMPDIPEDLTFSSSTARTTDSADCEVLTHW